MKIKKYASGGVYTGFTPSIPKTTGTTTTKNSGSSGSSKSPDLPFTKELMEMLAAKGLPSDNTVFSNELAQILYRAQVSGADMPAHITVAFANKANTMAGDYLFQNKRNEILNRKLNEFATSES